MLHFYRSTLVALLALTICCWNACGQEVPKQVNRVLFGSCIRQDNPVPILKEINSAMPDVFVFLGDNIYGDTEDMSVLKQKYGLLAAKPGFQELVERSVVLAMWDDHDYGANDAGAGYTKREQSREIFLDFWNQSDEATRESGGVFQSKFLALQGNEYSSCC